MTITESAPVTESSIRPEKIAHYECCIDPNRLLCGRDGTHLKTSWPTDPLCITCDVNYHKDVCPVTGVCSVEPYTVGKN